MDCGTDIDECSTQRPCLNGGTCVNTIGSFYCRCTEEWTGPTCGTCKYSVYRLCKHGTESCLCFMLDKLITCYKGFDIYFKHDTYVKQTLWYTTTS